MISKKEVLNQTQNSLGVYQHYINGLVLKGNRCKNISSPFRSDSNPSFSVYRNSKGLYLDTIANVRVRYVMKNDRLNKILTQFQNISTDYIKMKFDKYYSKTKISKYYFTKDYKYYRVVFKIGNYVSVNYQLVDLEDLDLEVSEEIKQRRKLYYDELNCIVEKEMYIVDY